MIFPATPKTVSHKFGGRITRVGGIGHRANKPNGKYSQDEWFFTGCTVEWQDGKPSSEIEIAPVQLCCDESERDETDALLAALHDYLRAHGEWHHTSTKQGWFAHDRLAAHSVRRRREKS